MSPTSVFVSEPKSIDLGGGSTWNVSTYSGGYAGKITLADATVESDNTVYADLSMMVGADNVAGTAADMGITSPIGDNPSIALGGLGTGVSPLEMADAYATLADGGERLSGTMLADDVPAPISITRVTDAHGQTLVRNTLVRSRVLLPWQAGLETSILQQVIARGTGQAAAIGRPAAGKTGTTTNFADAWFCGYTPDLVAAVWVGYPGSQIAQAVVDKIRLFPDFKTPPVTKRVVCAHNGALATRWCPERLKAFFFNGQGPTEWCTFHGPLRVSVPALTGLDLGTAQARLRAKKLGWQIVAVPGDPAHQGIVLGQAPASGESILQGNDVTLRVDNGPLPIVPDVVGQFRGAAEEALQAAGLSVAVTWDGVSGGAQGTVISQTPAGGTSGQGNIKIVVHGCAASVVVPSTKGMTLAAARAALAAVGLGAEVATESADALVISQAPSAGASLEPHPGGAAGAEHLSVAAAGGRHSGRRRDGRVPRAQAHATTLGRTLRRMPRSSAARSGDAAEEVARREPLTIAEAREAGKAVASKGASLVTAKIGLRDDHAPHTRRGELVQVPADVGHPRAEDAGLAGGDEHRERAGSPQALRQAQGVAAHEHLLAPEDQRLDERFSGHAR